MTPAQPDFVFAEEQDAILAIKRGDERLFVNLYYLAEHGVNNVAGLLDISPTLTRFAVRQRVIFSGKGYTRPIGSMPLAVKGCCLQIKTSIMHMQVTK